MTRKTDSVERHARKGASGKAQTESRNKYPRKRTSPAANEGAALDPCDVCGSENPDGLDILKPTICRGCYLHLEDMLASLREENDSLRNAMVMYGVAVRADPSVAATSEAPIQSLKPAGFTEMAEVSPHPRRQLLGWST